MAGGCGARRLSWLSDVSGFNIYVSAFYFSYLVTILPCGNISVRGAEEGRGKMSQVKCMAPDCENPAKWRMVLDLGDNAEMVEMVCVLHPDFGIEILAEYAAGDGIPDPEIKVTHAAIGEKEQECLV